MRSTRKSVLRHLVAPDAKSATKAPEVGLVLMDLSLKPIAYDRGAAAILLNKGYTSIKSESRFLLPREILETIGDSRPNDLSSVKMNFRLGNSEYNCRTYFMEPEGGLPAMVALHLERVSSLSDAVCAVAAKYRLTEREQEALRGITRGMSTKELAESMKISPNTVKVFMRLIMIKMGVTTRGAMVAHVLQDYPTVEDREENVFAAMV
jgi:DNA-binding CsgD family transcriptional regulator